MALFRQTWFFEGPGGTTWEEVWDVQATSSKVASPGGSDSIVLRRMALAHSTVTLNSIETKSLDNPDEPGVPVPILVSGTANRGAGTPANAAEAAVISVVCQASGGKLATRKLWLRGLEEGAVSRDAVTGAPVRSNDFQTNLDAFLERLEKDDVTNRVYGMRPRSRATYGGNPPRLAVVSVAAGPQSNLTVITLPEAHGYQVGQYIQVNAANQKKLPGFKGIFRVVAKDVTTITVAYKLPYTPADASGYVYAVVKDTFYKVTAGRSGFAFLGTRQTKKSGTRSRGRRSAVRLRR